MTLSLNRSNRLGILALALAYTGVTFGALTSPAPALAANDGPYYVAELAAPASESRTVAGGVAWFCEGTTCRAAKGNSSPLRISWLAARVRRSSELYRQGRDPGRRQAGSLQRRISSSPSPAGPSLQEPAFSKPSTSPKAGGFFLPARSARGWPNLPQAGLNQQNDAFASQAHSLTRYWRDCHQ